MFCKDFWNEFLHGGITEASLRKMCRSIPLGEWRSVLNAYWELIPSGVYSDKEKLEFVICGVYFQGKDPVETIKTALASGTEWVKQWNCPYAKPNIVNRVIKQPGGEHALKELVDISMKGYNAPERIKTNGWLRLVCLDHLIKCTDPEQVATMTGAEWVERIKKHIQHIKNVM